MHLRLLWIQAIPTLMQTGSLSADDNIFCCRASSFRGSKQAADNSFMITQDTSYKCLGIILQNASSYPNIVGIWKGNRKRCRCYEIFIRCLSPLCQLVQWGRTNNSILSYPLAPVNVLVATATKLTDKGGGVPNIESISDYEIKCSLDAGSETFQLNGGCIIIVSV